MPSSLSSDSRVPLYHQLADILLARIRAGEYPSGARIPSEPELARTFGIGRPTVRQATELLIRRQRLERRRGSGTYVTEPPEQVDLLSLAGTLASFEKTGLDVVTTLVQRAKRTVVADDPENPFGGREAWFLSRLSRVAGTPVLLESLWLDAERFPALDRISLAGRSLSQLADEHYHLEAQTADQNFRVVVPQSAQAKLLGLKRGAPALLVKRTIHFAGARDAVFSELLCRTDRLVFSQTLGSTEAARDTGVEGGKGDA
jgi:GntR family transcriptional regulator